MNAQAILDAARTIVISAISDSTPKPLGATDAQISAAVWDAIFAFNGGNGRDD